MGERPPTSRDLARLAGVSQATVSRVLTNNPRVSPDTRARVLQVLAETNYTPNALARAMKTGRTDTIGVFMTRVTSPFHAALLDEIGRRLSEAGLHMILWNIEHDPEESVAEVVQQRLVDGFILTSATYDSRLHAAAVASGTPTVLLHRGIDGLDCDQVVGDNWQGAYDAGRYLVEAGHRDIGLVTLAHTGNTSRDRDLGFRAALDDAGVKIKTSNVVTTGVGHADGHAAAQKLLSRAKPPTAIYTVTDLLAFGLLDGARARGVQVPDDVWLIGFDNTDLASWEAFDLTTVDQPVHAIVEAGLTLLRQRIADPARPTTTQLLPCPLVIRGSTANTPAKPTGKKSRTRTD
ncbi:LacI family transcriptional regulator [Kribbella amoyensis]|uniref:LacI family transcriptional regulator n=1 Tax=Kribbella amoyensis TaxID=996641 RepID=A0A561BR00_9ACTN|nr:LacI family DNA-binding transcriptional regulator [Kribbella amoyensis]TWD81281.1 LacI family transcriptional regulator [Kribbella amoyensis]